MALMIIISNRSDGSMKSAHDSDLSKINHNRFEFLSNNKIRPEDTTLVRLLYEGDDFRRYFLVSDLYKGDGITRESTISSDALVVRGLNHALFLPLADCIGAVLYDPTQDVLMVSHLGRHNLEQYGGIGCVEFMIDKCKVDPKNLRVWLSPAAGKLSYPLFAFNNLSLHEVATSQLINAGVLLKNIEISQIDTATDKDYYSHSQFLKGNQPDDGRFAIVAVLVND